MKNIFGRLPFRGAAFWGFFAIATLSVPMAGCGSIAGDRVDQICKCENCGQRQRQEYETIVDAEINVAEIYNCYTQLEPYYQCEIQEHNCQDNHYSDNDLDTPGCKHELDQYMQCLKGQSSRDPGPYETHP